VAQPLASVKNDPGIYPTPELLQKLTVQLSDSDDQTRAITRVWEKFKTVDILPCLKARHSYGATHDQPHA
jgi:hypothetical protein